MTYLTRVHSPFDRDHFDVIVFCCCFSARIDWYLGFSHRGRDCTSLYPVPLFVQQRKCIQLILYELIPGKVKIAMHLRNIMS